MEDQNSTSNPSGDIIKNDTDPDLLSEMHAWSAFLYGDGQNLDEMQSQLNLVESDSSLNLTISGALPIAPQPTLGGANDRNSNSPPNIDLNANVVTGGDACALSSEQSGAESKGDLETGSSSNPISVSSESSENVGDESNNDASTGGHSSNDRKRKTPDAAASGSTTVDGTTSSVVEQSRDSEIQGGTTNLQATGFHPINLFGIRINEAQNEERSGRNTRSRRLENNNGQVEVTDSTLVATGYFSGNPHVDPLAAAGGQTFLSSTTGIASALNPQVPPSPAMAAAPSYSQNQQPSASWNFVTRLRANSFASSSTFSPPAANFHVGESSRQGEMRASMARNFESYASRPNGFANYIQNVASGPRNLTDFGVRRQPPSRLWQPPNNFHAPYPIGAPAPRPLYPSYFATLPSIESVLSASAGNRRLPPASRFAPVIPPPPVGQPTIPPYQARARVIPQVRRGLRLVRRDGALHFEEVLIIDDIDVDDEEWEYIEEFEHYDPHQDMRLDVDNMTYEDLLAVGEYIGDVNTGLREEAVMTRLWWRIYSVAKMGVRDEPCCICQENYVENEELGKLDCGHIFHYNCIKQWLSHKNVCPICKRTGLCI